MRRCVFVLPRSCPRLTRPGEQNAATRPHTNKSLMSAQPQQLVQLPPESGTPQHALARSRQQLRVAAWPIAPQPEQPPQQPAAPASHQRRSRAAPRYRNRHNRASSLQSPRPQFEFENRPARESPKRQKRRLSANVAALSRGSEPTANCLTAFVEAGSLTYEYSPSSSWG